MEHWCKVEEVFDCSKDKVVLGSIACIFCALKVGVAELASECGGICWITVMRPNHVSILIWWLIAHDTFSSPRHCSHTMDMLNNQQFLLTFSEMQWLIVMRWCLALNSFNSTCLLFLQSEHRFQLGIMDDAAECFVSLNIAYTTDLPICLSVCMYVCLSVRLESVSLSVYQEKLLEQVHFHLTGSTDMDSCSLPYCISHQNAGLAFVEQVCEHTCILRALPPSTSLVADQVFMWCYLRTFPFIQFVHYVQSATVIVWVRTTCLSSLWCLLFFIFFQRRILKLRATFQPGCSSSWSAICLVAVYW